jgi:hypothetical protein
LSKLGITAGANATRRSPGKLSLGIPTIMPLPPLYLFASWSSGFLPARLFPNSLSLFMITAEEQIYQALANFEEACGNFWWISETIRQNVVLISRPVCLRIKGRGWGS